MGRLQAESRKCSKSQLFYENGTAEHIIFFFFPIQNRFSITTSRDEVNEKRMKMNIKMCYIFGAAWFCFCHLFRLQLKTLFSWLYEYWRKRKGKVKRWKLLAKGFFVPSIVLQSFIQFLLFFFRCLLFPFKFLLSSKLS